MRNGRSVLVGSISRDGAEGTECSCWKEFT